MMGGNELDGKLLKKLIIGGANEITIGTNALNALNVFPVPDGDTGTNMGHTVRAAAKEAMKTSGASISETAQSASGGALRGARGNSGVILSQLFRGFAKGLDNKTTANADDLAIALTCANEMAYKAVMKPKEGTMLTVGRAMAEAAAEVSKTQSNLETCLEFIINKSDIMLAKTPSMLPVLKQAGVVDSGGMGVVFFLKGALKALQTPGEIELIETAQGGTEIQTPAAMSPEDIEFAYCTEFLVEVNTDKNGAPEEVLRSFLPEIGDSVVVIEDDGLVKVHVHTNNPGLALEKAITFGQLLNIKIDNMREQHTELAQSNEPPKPIGVVAVAAGAGMVALFKGLGADIVIEGGQSMNPSAEEISEAIKRVNAETVIVLPNNKNILLTAEQAGKLTNDKHVKMMPTRSIPQGVACVIANSDTISLENNLAGMKEAMDAVHSGQITRAVRDTMLDGHNIKEGDFLCLYDGDIIMVKPNLMDAAKSTIDYMLEQGGDIVSLYYGEDAAPEQVDELEQYLGEKYACAEVEIHDGGQPLYTFILSVE